MTHGSITPYQQTVALAAAIMAATTPPKKLTDQDIENLTDLAQCFVNAACARYEPPTVLTIEVEEPDPEPPVLGGALDAEPSDTQPAAQEPTE